MQCIHSQVENQHTNWSPQVPSGLQPIHFEHAGDTSRDVASSIPQVTFPSISVNNCSNHFSSILSNVLIVYLNMKFHAKWIATTLAYTTTFLKIVAAVLLLEKGNLRWRVKWIKIYVWRLCDGKTFKLNNGTCMFKKFISSEIHLHSIKKNILTPESTTATCKNHLWWSNLRIKLHIKKNLWC